MTVSPMPTPTPTHLLPALDTPITFETILIAAVIAVFMYLLGTLTIQIWRAVQKRKNHRRRTTDRSEYGRDD